MGKDRVIKLVGEQWAAVLSLLALIGLWQSAAMIINDTLILPSFLQVLNALFQSWQAILAKDLPISSFTLFWAWPPGSSWPCP